MSIAVDANAVNPLAEEKTLLQIKLRPIKPINPWGR
jgi:hypothetical protein